jgi:cytochrome bd-type quinol oxidase subunit 2
MSDEGTGLGTLKGLPGGYDPGTTKESAMESLSNIFSNVLGVMTIVGGLMFVLYFVLGGISWLTSGGEREKVEKAKKQMTNAAIGLIVVVASYAIAFIVGKVLGIEILDPAKYLESLGPGAVAPETE